LESLIPSSRSPADHGNEIIAARPYVEHYIVNQSMKKIILSDKQLKELKEIPALEPGFKEQGEVGVFIDLWVVCEVLSKKYIMYHKQLSELPINWTYPQLIAALNSFSVSFDDKYMKPAFKSGNKGKRGSKSARQLRNGYIHTLSANDREEIETRHGDLVSNLRYWKNKLSNAV